MKGKPVAEQEIGRLLLNETVGYAESSVCRRKILLHYFGETYDESKCNNMCDNCKHPKQRFDAEEPLTIMLETVLAIKEKFKPKHIVDVLVGRSTSATKSYKHEALDEWGRGADEDDKFWMSVVRQGVVHDFLQKDIESYGILSLTKKGKDFLKKPFEILFTKDIDFEAADDEEDIVMAGAGKGGGLDDTLLSILKDLRKKLGKKLNMPPFVIFQDPSLEDMAINYPITMDEMKNIQGVGQGKAIKFGQEFVDVIASYVEENEIIRPMDMVVKSIVNKSTNKVYIIQNIDRKLDLEDIAKAKGMSMDDLLCEIESIVSSGTRINIDYYINEEIDEDKQDEVYDYFRTAETDSIDFALKELGEEDYTEEEIRLMRIKFISELGN
jgi:ATP-dependent DNA helicase RecQ